MASSSAMCSMLLRAPITYEVPGSSVHSPMVHARVGGMPTKLVLDTGSTDHVLTMELVRRAGIPAEPSEEGTDAAGASVQSWLIGSLPVTVAGVTLPLANVVAFNGPDLFEGWGIGGFLSPQHLHPNANVILDFAGAELTIVEGEPADVGAKLMTRFPHLRPVWLDRQVGDTTVLVRAGIQPHPDVVTMLDSGGKVTEFVRAAVPGLATDAREATGRGVSGTQMHGSPANRQTLRVGDTTLPVAKLFVRPRMSGGAPGVVGMDVMRGTVLMVGADIGRRVLWLVSADRVERSAQ